MQIRKDFYGSAVEAIAHHLATKEPFTHRQPQADIVIACGESACSKMVTIFDDGSQRREKRSVAIVTLDAEHERLVVTPCDTHGGRKLPTTEQINGALGFRPVTRAQAQELLVSAAIDSSSDGRTYEEMAMHLGLVGRTEVNYAFLEGNRV